MSSSCYWEPAFRPTKRLSDAMKYALRKRFGEPVHVQMSEQHVSYLNGLADAGIEGAEDLIAAIEKYTCISVDEHN